MKLPIPLLNLAGCRLPPGRRRKRKLPAFSYSFLPCQDPKRVRIELVFSNDDPNPTPSHVLYRSGSATSCTGGGEDICDSLCFWENLPCNIFYTFWKSVWLQASYSGARKAVWAGGSSELKSQGTCQTRFMWHMYWSRLFCFEWQKLYSNCLKKKKESVALSLETPKVDPNALGCSWIHGLQWIYFALHLWALLAPAWSHPQLSRLHRTTASNLNLCFPGLATPRKESLLVSYLLFLKCCVRDTNLNSTH